ncbi:MAG: TlpA family protein disulfide reductase [Planctomycetota bacterium]
MTVPLRFVSLLATAAAALITVPAPAQFHEFDAEALKAFDELVQAYRARPALIVKATVKVEIGEGEVTSKGPEVTAEFTLGRDRTGVVKLRGYTCYLSEGTVTATHEATEHSYFRMPDDDAPLYALMTGFVDLPFPHLALAFGDEELEFLCMEFHQKAPWARPTSVGTIEKDGRTLRQIRFTSDYEDMDVLVDPATQLIQSIELRITGGDLVQTGAEIRYRHAYEYQTPDQPLPASTFAFDPGTRQRVDVLVALAPRPTPGQGGGAEPGAAGALVGQAAPPLLLATSDGGAVDLEEHRGEVVVLDFWATWCGPCRKALPQLHEVAAWAAAAGLPVTVIPVNTSERPRDAPDTPENRLKAVTDFWKDAGYTLPVAMDYTDEVAAAYGVSGIPATFIIRADGVVHAQHTGAGADYAAQLKAEIQEALQAPDEER